MSESAAEAKNSRHGDGGADPVRPRGPATELPATLNENTIIGVRLGSVLREALLVAATKERFLADYAIYLLVFEYSTKNRSFVACYFTAL